MASSCHRLPSQTSLSGWLAPIGPSKSPTAMQLAGPTHATPFKVNSLALPDGTDEPASSG